MLIGIIAIFEVQLLLSLSSLPSLSLPGFIIPPDFFGNLIRSTIALFVVIDPVGSVPLFIALTEKMEKNERKAVVKNCHHYCGCLLLTVFAVAGSEILAIFGITIYSFMVAGGSIAIVIVSIELLTHGVLEIWCWNRKRGWRVRSSSIGLSFACRSWSNYFSYDLISKCWLDSDNVIYLNCDCHYLYSSTIG